MEIDKKQMNLLAESLFDSAEDYLQIAKTGNARMIRVSRFNSQELATIQNLCGTVGDVANVATTIITTIRDIKRIKAEAEIILGQLDGRVKVTLEQIKAISISLETLQKIILSMPDDFSDKEQTARKTQFILKMCDLSMEIAKLM